MTLARELLKPDGPTRMNHRSRKVSTLRDRNNWIISAVQDQERDIDLLSTSQRGALGVCRVSLRSDQPERVMSFITMSRSRKGSRVRNRVQRDPASDAACSVRCKAKHRHPSRGRSHGEGLRRACPPSLMNMLNDGTDIDDIISTPPPAQRLGVLTPMAGASTMIGNDDVPSPKTPVGDSWHEVDIPLIGRAAVNMNDCSTLSGRVTAKRNLRAVPTDCDMGVWFGKVKFLPPRNRTNR
jgi:hypothetical protein